MLQSNHQSLTALTTGVALLDDTDSSIDINEFGVTFSGDQLIITNSKGRALAIEEYSSTHGFMTVTPINEPGAAQVLASQNAYFSETRVLMNTSVFGQALSANDTNLFTFSLDGVSNSAALRSTLVQVLLMELLLHQPFRQHLSVVQAVQRI